MAYHRTTNVSTPFSQLRVALWTLLEPHIMVHRMGSYPISGDSLLYSSLDGVTVSTGAFNPLPVYGMVVHCDVIGEG